MARRRIAEVDDACEGVGNMSRRWSLLVDRWPKTRGAVHVPDFWQLATDR